MVTKTVKHQFHGNNWPDPHSISPNIKTLVLGTFNPFESEENSLDYYYGRGSNNFWKSIARNIGKNEKYFFQVDPIGRKWKAMETYKFCCMDLIDSIEFSGESEELINLYLKKKVFANFPDSSLFLDKAFTLPYSKKLDSNPITKDLEKRISPTTNKPTSFVLPSPITIKRNYNHSIVETITKTKSITRVINTLGQTISINATTNEISSSLGDDVFLQLVKDIINSCPVGGFIYESISPSQMAVNTGGKENRGYKELDIWLNKMLQLEK